MMQSQQTELMGLNNSRYQYSFQHKPGACDDSPGLPCRLVLRVVLGFKVVSLPAETVSIQQLLLQRGRHTAVSGAELSAGDALFGIVQSLL